MSASKAMEYGSEAADVADGGDSGDRPKHRHSKKLFVYPKDVTSQKCSRCPTTAHQGDRCMMYVCEKPDCPDGVLCQNCYTASFSKVRYGNHLIIFLWFVW